MRKGEEIRLTKIEWGLLETLSEHPGKLQTHRWLLERVWRPGYAGDVDVLRVFISQLRRKIEPDREGQRSSRPIRASGAGGFSDQPATWKPNEGSLERAMPPPRLRSARGIEIAGSSAERRLLARFDQRRGHQ